MINKNYLVLLFILLSIYCYSQNIEVSEYTVRFKSLSIKDGDDNYRHIAESIPRFLYYEFKEFPLHTYSGEEITALNKRILEKYIQDHSLNLSSLLEKRDSFVFTNNYTKEEYSDINQQIETERLLLSDTPVSGLLNRDLKLPVKFILDNKSSFPDEKNTDIQGDLVVTGQLEKLNEWIYLKIWVENNILDVKSVIYDSITNPDKIAELIPEIKKRLNSIILGRPWAGLILELEPEDSSFILRNQNNEIVGDDLNLLYPGLYRLDISKSGYKPEYFSIDLEEEEIQTVEVKLDIVEKSPVSVQSFPDKADVYSGATWIGKTPLFIMNPMFPSLLTLKLEGYNDYKYILNDNAQRDVKIFLQSSLIDQNKIIDKKRNNFYNSFSYFLLSIPISLVSYGLSSDYGYAYNREVEITQGSVESERLMQLSTSWYNVYIGGIFINITLFINAVFDLVDYIKSNEKL